MATAKRLVVNPADVDQMYILWDNGKVSAFGGAPPMAGIPAWFEFEGVEAPARAIQVIDWSKPSGYIMDYYGRVYPFGGTTIPSGPAAPVVEPYRIAVDFVMNPAGDGQGYSLMSNGVVQEFGGAPGVTAGPSLPYNTGRRLVMQWSSKKYYVLDCQGRIYWRASAPAITAGPRWNGLDIARDLKIIDWATGKGYLLNGWGEVWPINGAQAAPGFYNWPGQDMARDMAIIDDGLGATPLTIVTLGAGGGRHSYVVSSKPTVDVTGPSGTVTDTTRPTVTFDYSDPQGDAMYRYQSAIYSDDQYGTGGFSPFADAWYADAVAKFKRGQVSRTARGYEVTKDLPADTYRVYVRVQDTSGLWSDPDYSQFTLAPVAPSVPTLTVADAGNGLKLTATHSSPAAGHLNAFLYVDFATGETHFVRNGEAVDASSGTATVTDYEVPLGENRIYYAVTYTADPYLSSVGSSLVVAKLDIRDWWLTSVDDPTKGGAFDVAEPFSFTRPRRAGVFAPVGRKFPVVVTDGAVKAATASLQVRLLSKADYDRLEEVLSADGCLLLRDPLGRSWYCYIVGDVAGQILRAAKDGLNDYPIRHAHEVTVPLIEVDRPSTEDPEELTVAAPDMTFYD